MRFTLKIIPHFVGAAQRTMETCLDRSSESRVNLIPPAGSTLLRLKVVLVALWGGGLLPCKSIFNEEVLNAGCCVAGFVLEVRFPQRSNCVYRRDESHVCVETLRLRPEASGEKRLPKLLTGGSKQSDPSRPQNLLLLLKKKGAPPSVCTMFCRVQKSLIYL